MMEALLTGSVPMQPASAVFQTVSKYLGDVVRRIPDGEQGGWVETVRKTISQHPALEPGSTSRIGTVANFARQQTLYRLKPGRSAREVQLGSLGFADNALASYAVFRRLRDEGRIRAGTRFQATVAGPATTGGMLELPEADVFAIVERPLAEEIRRIVAGIPAEDLTLQLDLAVEVEKEEYDRRPQAFDTPVFGLRRFTLAGTTDAVARLALGVPKEVELGFHLCALWHVFKGAGQDLRVHVDYANMLSRKIARPIAYFHMPTTPEYEAKDFAPLKALALQPQTRLYLGLIHAVDGLEGAQRRASAARSVIEDFGIGHFCGLSQWGAGADTVAPMLELHRRLARSG